MTQNTNVPANHSNLRENGNYHYSLTSVVAGL